MGADFSESSIKFKNALHQLQSCLNENKFRSPLINDPCYHGVIDKSAKRISVPDDYFYIYEEPNNDYGKNSVPDVSIVCRKQNQTLRHVISHGCRKYVFKHSPSIIGSGSLIDFNCDGIYWILPSVFSFSSSYDTMFTNLTSVAIHLDYRKSFSRFGRREKSPPLFGTCVHSMCTICVIRSWTI